VRKVKKILALEKMLLADTNMTDKKRQRINKKIKKLKENLLIAETETLDRKKLRIFLTMYGIEVLVEEYDIVLVRRSDKFLNVKNRHLLSYLMAFMCLIIIYLFISGLHIFGVINENLHLSFSLVLSLAGVVLNVWTAFDCRSVFKEFKMMWVITIFAILINVFGATFDILQMVGYF
jgi:hypothetical protein